MWSGYEEGSYLRRIDFVSLTSRLESNQEEEAYLARAPGGLMPAWDLGFGVWGFGPGVLCVGFGGWILELRVWCSCSGFRIQGAGCRLEGEG